MPIFTRPVFTVFLDRLTQNYRALQTITPARAAAVIKDDAYGLGARKVARHLAGLGCDAFFVAHAAEGAVCRSVAPHADIYVLQGIGKDSLALFKKHRLTPVLSTPQMLACWRGSGMTHARPVLQVETGLNRLGFRLADLAALSGDLRQEFSYVLSHLACADEPGHFMNERQLKAFETIRRQTGLPASLAASDGVFLGDSYHYDMVRLGAALYGLHVTPGATALVRPCVHVSAPVLQVCPLEKGAFVGYGASYQAPCPMRLAVVGIGYGDGLPRALGNHGQVRINGVFAPIIGRISMDNIMCDVTRVPNVQEGQFAQILDDVYTADSMAADAGTIGYEILSRIGKGKRFCRTYKK